MAPIYSFSSVMLIILLVFLRFTAGQVTYEVIEDQLAIESRRNEENSEISTHSQKLEQGRTRGEYRIFLPDNRWQIVSYVADDNGYRATVRYESSPESSSPPETSQTHWGFSTGTKAFPVQQSNPSSYRPDSPPRNLQHPQTTSQEPDSSHRNPQYSQPTFQEPPLRNPDKYSDPDSPSTNLQYSQASYQEPGPPYPPRYPNKEYQESEPQRRPLQYSQFQSQNPDSLSNPPNSQPITKEPDYPPGNPPNYPQPTYQEPDSPPRNLPEYSQPKPQEPILPPRYIQPQQPIPPPRNLPEYSQPKLQEPDSPPRNLPEYSQPKPQEPVPPPQYSQPQQPLLPPRNLPEYSQPKLHEPDSPPRNLPEYSQPKPQEPILPPRYIQPQQPIPPPRNLPEYSQPKFQEPDSPPRNLPEYSQPKPQEPVPPPQYSQPQQPLPPPRNLPENSQPKPQEPILPPNKPTQYYFNDPYRPHPVPPNAGLLRSQVNTYIVHPTPTREPEDERRPLSESEPERPRPLPEYRPYNRPIEQPPRPPVLIPKPYPADPKPEIKPESEPDPPVYIPQEKPKPEFYDDIIYNPKVFHPFFEPLEEDKPSKKVVIQPIRPFHFANESPKPNQQTATPHLERPARPNPTENEPRPHQENSQDDRPVLTTTYNNEKVQDQPPNPNYQSSRPVEIPEHEDEIRPQRPSEPSYSDVPASQQRPSYQPEQQHPTRLETYPDKPTVTYEPDPYEKESSYQDRPTATYIPKEKPKYSDSPPPYPDYSPTQPAYQEPEIPYADKPTRPIQSEYNEPVFYPIRPSPPAFEPEHEANPVQQYVPQQEYDPYRRPYPFKLPDRPYQILHTDQRPLYQHEHRPQIPESYKPTEKYKAKRPHTGYPIPHTGYPIPHTGYPPEITAIRPIPNPKDQLVVTIRPVDIESLEGIAPTELPEEPEIVLTTTAKPRPVPKWKSTPPVSRKPFLIRTTTTAPITEASTTETSIEEGLTLLNRFKFRNRTPSVDFGNRIQPRMRTRTRQEIGPVNDFASPQENGGQSESIRSGLRLEKGPPFLPRVIEPEPLSDLEGFPPIEEELVSNITSDSDMIIFDDGESSPLILRMGDKGSHSPVEEVTPLVTTEVVTESPTTTTTSTTTSRPTTTTTTTTEKPTTTTTKAGKKKKKRVRVKGLKRGNGTRPLLVPANSQRVQTTVVLKNENKTIEKEEKVVKLLPVSKTLPANNTAVNRSSKIRFPPKIRFVEKNADRVARQNGKDDLITAESAQTTVYNNDRIQRDMIVDHVSTSMDLMDFSLNGIPIDQLDLVYESAQSEEIEEEE